MLTIQQIKFKNTMSSMTSWKPEDTNVSEV